MRADAARFASELLANCELARAARHPPKREILAHSPTIKLGLNPSVF